MIEASPERQRTADCARHCIALRLNQGLDLLVILSQ